MKIKKLDTMLVRGFFPPFIVAFGIGLFVLIMQYLWLYADEIMGKGAGLLMIVELIFYMSISMFPMAMVIGVLLASVMTMGNLAEKYELAAMKSSGMSLWRVMSPLIVVGIGLASFSFFSSNYLMPVANLKFKSRLYDIRTQKPTLSLEESSFNYDFQGYVIRIGKKMEDNIHLEDILIYNESKQKGNDLTEILAKKGEMFTTDDQQYFVMRLHDGWEYQEVDRYQNPKKKYPLVRIKFKEWRKVFDLSEFQIDRTDEDLFKSHQTMLNVSQLAVAIDSLRKKQVDRLAQLKKTTSNYFPFVPAAEVVDLDSTSTDTLSKGAQYLLDSKRKQNRKPSRRKVKVIAQDSFQMDSLTSFLNTFPKAERRKIVNNAKNSARLVQNKVYTASSRIASINKSLIKHEYEWHSKFNLAVACLVFLFVGAPLGAIIRKGGFGYPILVSIVFFIIFIMLTTAGKKMVDERVLPVWAGAWMANIVIFPIGVLITSLAMKDRNLQIDVNQWWIIKWIKAILKLNNLD